MDHCNKILKLKYDVFCEVFRQWKIFEGYFGQYLQHSCSCGVNVVVGLMTGVK